MKRERVRVTEGHLTQRGFTLIELMITITILAILTATALPSFRSFIVGQRIKNASFDIMSSLILARSEAIKRNTNVAITPNNGSWLSGWTIVAGGNSLKQQEALGSGLSVTCYSGTAVAPCSAITFVNKGRLPPGTSAPSVQLTSNDVSNATRCIGIDLSGRPNNKKASCP